MAVSVNTKQDIRLAATPLSSSVKIRLFAAMLNLLILSMNCVVMTWGIGSTSFTTNCKGLPSLGLGIVDKLQSCPFFVEFSSCGSYYSFYQKLADPLKLPRHVEAWQRSTLYRTLLACASWIT